MSRVVATTCPYCGVGCGVLAESGPGGTVTVQGDPEHPANRGRLCSKGAALGETMSLEGRLLEPEIGGRRVSWEEALEAVASGFRRVIEQHGPEAVAFYVSGQLLTEDYYVANKLMKGFIGSGNIDTNSRLCMSSAVAGHRRAFGSDTVPGCYEDLELADLLVLAGSNLAWCHPVLFQRIRRAKQERPEMKVVVIDPRRTATCDLADLHLPLAPGTDAWLFNGLLNHLRREDRLDLLFLERHVEGFSAALEAARRSAPSIPAVAAACGLPEQAVAEFFRLFATTGRTVTLYSQGINQSSSGTDRNNAILNCHLATGRIGRPGMGPFSITGQPNAMGGREVGGLANTLAAHMDFTPENRERLARFWGSGRVAASPGLKAVDLFRAVGAGRVKAIWIMGTNPVVSLPDADRVREALKECELVVVSDCIRETDTTACADILLPAAAWGEKEGTVTNSERRISRQRRFLPLPGQARPDWWILTQVARRMGFGEAFPYQGPADVFREHAALSGFENGGGRDFDISALAGIGDGEYQELAPFQWPWPAGAPGGRERLFADGRFYTGSGRARMLPVEPAGPAEPVSESWPFILNTGRVRDQWHTMTRTGRSPRLSEHTVEPYVQIHPVDARSCGLREGELASVESRHGKAILRVVVSAEQRPGSLFVPMHWNDQFASCGRVDALVPPITDPVSGQPGFKHTPVRLAPFRPRWHGFLLSRRPLQPGTELRYWARAIGQDFWRTEMAGENLPEDWGAWARERFGEAGEWLEFLDAAAGRYRMARIIDHRLDTVMFVSPDTQLPPRSWLARLFARESIDAAERASLLAGRPGQGQEDGGRTLCACFGIGEKTLREAIRTQGLDSVEAIGEALKAGTNCGSCIPELRSLLESVAEPCRG